ncbi:MAG: glutamine--tRNA ligase/YqeY domain fusion protein [Candidatus Eisenbacteria bacterium]|nr:glutamine--tRNA ligase/YqeY domain fusion protein [Candidatus Eisenbacteria bacterium]
MSEPGDREPKPAAEGEEQFDFIRATVVEHMKSGRFDGRVHTRFPPEPNGFLHIGHAKAISIDFGIAAEFGGQCNLRMDDSNPAKENVEYVTGIQEDVRWLGYDWEDRLYYASDYFEQLYEYAVALIRMGKAYVDELTPDEIRAYRGTLTAPGRASPYRDRPIEENLDQFARMRAGEFPDGSKVLRAKIDMSSGNVNLRDPVIYRILRAEHYRQGSKWCIYPMYDFTHCLSDSIERITHSICTLEFEDHRPLYDWYLDQLGVYHPQQIEFAPLVLSYTVLSKRRLKQLVDLGLVDGWDDPRMPTISGMRRRGYTPEAIRDFMKRVGVAKRDSIVDIALLEFCLREDLNRKALRRMAVLRPVKLVIDNYPAGQVEDIEAQNNPEDESAGTRMVPFCRELYIERDDFRETPPKKFFRLSPGKEVRLKYAYYVTCTGVVKDPASGEVTEIHCDYAPDSKGGWTSDGRMVRGTLHWVSAAHAAEGEARLFEHLYDRENPLDLPEGGDFKDHLRPQSREILTGCRLEPSLADARGGERFQFLRQGYFFADPSLSKPGKPVFNRTVSLKDSWAKIEKSAGS